MSGSEALGASWLLNSTCGVADVMVRVQVMMKEEATLYAFFVYKQFQ
jgi:hypothetical protein